MAESNKTKHPGWGGKRPGAGRPRSTGDRRRNRGVYCTDAELAKLKEYLKELRSVADMEQN